MKKHRNITQLAKYLNIRHKQLSWRGLARAEYPDVPAGTLSSIAKGFEPARPATRARLGLPHVCTSCHRRIKHKRVRAAVEVSDAALWWRAQTPEQHKRYIEELYLEWETA